MHIVRFIYTVSLEHNTNTKSALHCSIIPMWDHKKLFPVDVAASWSAAYYKEFATEPSHKHLSRHQHESVLRKLILAFLEKA